MKLQFTILYSEIGNKKYSIKKVKRASDPVQFIGLYFIG